jgi:hypothetical protein
VVKTHKKKRIKEKAHNSLSALTILIEDISPTPSQNSHHKRYKLSGIFLLCENRPKGIQMMKPKTKGRDARVLHGLLP